MSSDACSTLWNVHRVSDSPVEWPPAEGPNSVVERLAPRAPTAPLDLHEGLPHGGCARWPKKLRLRSSDGRYVVGRCRAANLCPYCARLASVVAAEMLALDALNGDAPTTLMVLTTRTAAVEQASFEYARKRLTAELRRCFGRVEYASLLEWTTGYGPRSGGLRRPHWNWMLKGIAESDYGQVRELIADVWCELVDAEPGPQHVGPIYEAGGLTRYLAMHFLKESQAPPAGFRGQRFNCTRGYFGELTRAQARRAAEDSLRSKRELWKALRDGYEGHEAELVAALEVEAAKGREWSLVEVRSELHGLVVEAVEVGGIARERGRRVHL